MKVRRVKTQLGFTKYEVVDCGHVRIASPTMVALAPGLLEFLI